METDAEGYKLLFERYLREHEAGNAAASYELGKLYFEGKGVAQNYVQAADIWEHAAQAGNADATRAIADCYFRGQGRNEDNVYAKKLYERAIQLNPSDGEAKAQIGKMYRSGWGVEKNYDTALSYLECAWNDGYLKAAGIIGDMFNYSGDSTEAQYRVAAKYYQRGADAGEPGAIHELAICYEDGLLGFPHSLQLALSLFRKNLNYIPTLCYLLTKHGDKLSESEAATNVQKALVAAEYGDKMAQHAIGDLYRKGVCVSQDYQLAEKWLLLAADEDDVSPYCDLGYCYAFGDDGFPKDGAKAVKYLEIAANNGNLYAMTLLGDIYQDDDIDDLGYDWFTRYRSSFRWRKEAANQANGDDYFREDTAYKCAKMLFDGKGCDKDEKQGFYYLELAGSLHYEPAYLEIVDRCLWGKGTHPDYRKAHIYLKLASENARERNWKWDLAEVEYYLGVMYENGFGLDKNFDEAFRHYTKAKDMDCFKADKELQRFKKGIFGWKVSQP